MVWEMARWELVSAGVAWVLLVVVVVVVVMMLLLLLVMVIRLCVYGGPGMRDGVGECRGTDCIGEP